MSTMSPADDVLELLEQDLFWKLTNDLVRHEVAEERVVYPLLRGLPGGETVADPPRNSLRLSVVASEKGHEPS